MIEYKTGDIFDEDVEALVNTVNCVGVMGRGIALQFKNRFPDNFRAYAEACKRDEVRPGRMFICETKQLSNPRYVINFPTKRHWRGKSRIEDIRSGLDALASEIQERGIRSVAIPPLATNLGGLDWDVVRPMIETAVGALEGVDVIVFTPESAPADGRPNFSTNVPNMTAGRAALVSLISRYLGGLLDPQITLLEIHKLMYFMQAAGEPLKLRFQKAHYGPYADNLRHVLRRIEGHLVSGYRNDGDAPDKLIELVPGAIEDAVVFLEANPETQSRLRRVSDLVEGFESSFGLELLSTVHWVAQEHTEAPVESLVEYTYAWNRRKRQFSRRQITLAYDTLSDKGWISQPTLGHS